MAGEAVTDASQDSSAGPGVERRPQVPARPEQHRMSVHLLRIRTCSWFPGCAAAWPQSTFTRVQRDGIGGRLQLPPPDGEVVSDRC